MLLTLKNRFIIFIRVLLMYITKKVDISLPGSVIERFCERSDYWYFYLNDNLTSKDIKILYDRRFENKYFNDLILSEIAQHINTPTDIIEELSDSEDRSVLLSLATNPNISKSVVIKLLRYDDKSVTEHLKSNRYVDNNLLKIAIGDIIT